MFFGLCWKFANRRSVGRRICIYYSELASEGDSFFLVHGLFNGSNRKIWKLWCRKGFKNVMVCFLKCFFWICVLLKFMVSYLDILCISMFQLWKLKWNLGISHRYIFNKLKWTYVCNVIHRNEKRFVINEIIITRNLILIKFHIY